jgi:transposase-like protein
MNLGFKPMLVTTQTHVCHCCSSSNIVKNGRNRNGGQRYLCRDCGVSRVVKYKPKYTEERKAEILRAYQERSSIRGVCRTFGTAKQTLSNWLKKSG